MVDLETARNLCLSLPSVEEYDHFGKPAYRVGKKIIVTLSLEDKRAVVKLSQTQQPELCDQYHPAVSPVKNKWGELGWTTVELDHVNVATFKKLIELAWTNVAPKAMTKKRKAS